MRPRINIGLCSVDGCERDATSKGMCNKHYKRTHLHGDPYTVQKNERRRKKINFEIDKNGCFICTSHRPKGIRYPRLMIDKKEWIMSRFIYEQCFGVIPEGHVIRHKCDNPLCINPEHLETGTPMDNYMDAVMRNRTRCLKGSDVPQSKLTEDKVKEIRKLVHEGNLKTLEIAMRFNIAPGTVNKIGRRASWKHVD